MGKGSELTIKIRKNKIFSEKYGHWKGVIWEGTYLFKRNLGRIKKGWGLSDLTFRHVKGFKKTQLKKIHRQFGLKTKEKRGGAY